MLSPVTPFLFAAAALAAPAAISMRDVSASVTNELSYISQYAAAAYCYENTHGSSGTEIACEPGNCLNVTASGAYLSSTFSTYLDGSENMGGFVAIDPAKELIVLAFRGTANSENYEVDLEYSRVDSTICSGCTVHEGFWETWLAAKNASIAGLTNATSLFPGYKIVTTGHSLGAAVAALAAGDLRNSGYDVGLYTYGQPRIGGAALSDYISNQSSATYRVTHTKDIVPQLPEREWDLLDPWSNISPEYWIDTDALPVPPANISVCLGDDNDNCNSGTGIAADVLEALLAGNVSTDVLHWHRWYFNQFISECNSTAPSS